MCALKGVGLPDAITQRVRRRTVEEILIPVGAFAAIVAIIWVRGRVSQVRFAKQAETQQLLLGKCQSGQELADFIETEGGQRFLRQFESNPHGMILGFLSTGIVSTVLGLGFFGLMTQDGGFLYPGVITLALGVGLILAAAISRRLSQEWRPDP